MFWRPDAEYDECEFDEDEEVRLLTKLLIPEKSIEAPIIAIHAMVEAAAPAEMLLFLSNDNFFTIIFILLSYI